LQARVGAISLCRGTQTNPWSAGSRSWSPPRGLHSGTGERYDLTGGAAPRRRAGSSPPS
jgi:hypothetical protein